MPARPNTDHSGANAWRNPSSQAYWRCVARASGAAALKKKPGAAGSTTDLTGVWVMTVEGHQLGLELEQKEQKVEGVMLAMGRRVLLVGDFVDRVLTLKGERPEDGAGFSKFLWDFVDGIPTASL